MSGGLFTPQIILAAALMTSCHGTWFNGRLDGVPLSDFNARDGRYFPPFVTKFFRGAQLFEREYPSLAQARSGLHMIEVKPLNAQEAPFNEANLSWSADGVYLGFEVVNNLQRKILLKDLVGDYSRELMVLPKGSSNFLDGMVARSVQSYNAGLRWSRDSTRYAFMSNGGVGEYSIYVGAIGAKEKPVARSQSKDGFATWSPKTNEIAFVSARTGGGDIYLVDLGNQKVQRLSTQPKVDIFPEWSPDARRIVYSSGDALDHDIWAIERADVEAPWDKPYPLTQSPRDELRPTVSPDGKYVAFYADDGTTVEQGAQRWNIHVVALKSGPAYTAAQLAQAVVARDVVIDLNTGPAWSPDSRKLVFVKRDPGNFNPIHGYDLFSGQSYMFKTNTRMNRDILVSKLGILSFRAQVGVWDRVFVALTNQGLQLQTQKSVDAKVNYVSRL